VCYEPQGTYLLGIQRGFLGPCKTTFAGGDREAGVLGIVSLSHSGGMDKVDGTYVVTIVTDADGVPQVQ
jgi:hypothetical protein